MVKMMDTQMLNDDADYDTYETLQTMASRKSSEDDYDENFMDSGSEMANSQRITVCR